MAADFIESMLAGVQMLNQALQFRNQTMLQQAQLERQREEFEEHRRVTQQKLDMERQNIELHRENLELEKQMAPLKMASEAATIESKEASASLSRAREKALGQPDVMGKTPSEVLRIKNETLHQMLLGPAGQLPEDPNNQFIGKTTDDLQKELSALQRGNLMGQFMPGTKERMAQIQRIIPRRAEQERTIEQDIARRYPNIGAVTHALDVPQAANPVAPAAPQNVDADAKLKVISEFRTAVDAAKSSKGPKTSVALKQAYANLRNSKLLSDDEKSQQMFYMTENQ